MRTVGFFNNKGGVGKTTLVYHVAWMLGLLGRRVLAVDLDPQANLTSMFLPEERLEAIWEQTPRPTLYGAVAPQFRGVGDIAEAAIEVVPQFRGVGEAAIETVHERVGLLAGDLELARFEDQLALAWPIAVDGDERAFRVLSAFARVIAGAGATFEADLALVDVGPNLGALNRAALLACDHILVPLGADLFSLQGLRNMGPTLREWREGWARRREKNPDPALALPTGDIAPIGYVVMRHSVLAGRPARAFGKWIGRIPGQYRQFMLDRDEPAAAGIEIDPNQIARLKDYRSLMPLAQEAHKPMFLLRPADGAFGGHQGAVTACYEDFAALAREVARRAGLE